MNNVIVQKLLYMNLGGFNMAKFNQNDCNLLKSISEIELYTLNLFLTSTANSVKNNILNIMFGEQKICELVDLAEIAAKEVSERMGYLPEKSNGIYSKGFTYDTKAYRFWIIACGKKYSFTDIIECSNFLEDFSFYPEISEIYENAA